MGARSFLPPAAASSAPAAQTSCQMRWMSRAVAPARPSPCVSGRSDYAAGGLARPGPDGQDRPPRVDPGRKGDVQRFRVNTIGLSARVADRLRELGFRQVVAVNVAERARDPERYAAGRDLLRDARSVPGGRDRRPRRPAAGAARGAPVWFHQPRAAQGGEQRGDAGSRRAQPGPGGRAGAGVRGGCRVPGAICGGGADTRRVAGLSGRRR
jgi:hypothetical protein